MACASQSKSMNCLFLGWGISLYVCEACREVVEGAVGGRGQKSCCSVRKYSRGSVRPTAFTTSHEICILGDIPVPASCGGVDWAFPWPWGRCPGHSSSHGGLYVLDQVIPLAVGASSSGHSPSRGSVSTGNSPSRGGCGQSEQVEH